MDTTTRKRTRKTHPIKAENNSKRAEPHQLIQLVMETEFRHYYYYSLVESIPFPEPTWSTTAPVVMCAAPPEPAEDALQDQFEWAADDDGESYAAAEAWWVGFLKSLDCKSGKGEMVNNNQCRAAQENVAVVESCKEAATAAMDSGGTFPEDWLCFPAADDHGDELVA